MSGQANISTTNICDSIEAIYSKYMRRVERLQVDAVTMTMAMAMTTMMTISEQ